jgi:hypothetical protein
MYIIQHYFKALKGFLRNKGKPKGSMVKGYALEEGLGFCT